MSRASKKTAKEHVIWAIDVAVHNMTAEEYAAFLLWLRSEVELRESTLAEELSKP